MPNIKDLPMPSAPQMERSLLSMAVMYAADVLPQAMAEGVTREIFYVPAYRCCWEMVVRMFSQGRPIHITALAQELDNAGMLESVGVYAGLCDITTAEASLAFYADTVAQLRDMQLRRAMVKLGEQARDTSQMLHPEKLSNLLAETAVSKGKNTPPTAELAEAAVVELEELVKGGTLIRGERTGFPALDTMLGGLQGGTFNIIGARPAMGKTAFGMNVALQIARAAQQEERGRVLFLTAEMTPLRLVMRALLSLGRVRLQELLQARNQRNQASKRLIRAFNELKTLPLDFADVTGWSIGRVAQYVEAQHRKTPLRVVVLDYLQLLRGNTSAAGEDEKVKLEEISGGLQNLAKRLQIPVLTLAQVNREAAKNAKAPTLADLRGSGSMEQDADAVILLHRPAYYADNALDNEQQRRETQVFLAKNRHGETGKLTVYFYGEYYLFVPDN